MSNSPAYLMYPADILSSGRVAALDALEELWYRRAIDLGWESGGMPSNPKEFAGWVGRGCTVAAARKLIRIFYKPHRNNPALVVQPRQEEERRKFLKKKRQKSEAGKKGMASRWKQTTSSNNSVITEDNIPIPISITKKEEEEEEKEQTAMPSETRAREVEQSPTDLKTHPTIVAVQTATNRYPPKEIRQELIDQLGTDIDTNKLRKCFVAWVARGYNRTNYEWALDWYLNGIPPSGKRQEQTHGTHRRNSGSGNGQRRTSSAERIAATHDILDQYPTEAELGRGS